MHDKYFSPVMIGHKQTISRPLAIFTIAAALAVLALLVSRYIPQFSFLYFASLVSMVATFIVSTVKGNRSQGAIIAQLVVVSLLARCVSPIQSGCPSGISGAMRAMYAADYITQAGHVPLYYPAWRMISYTFWPGSHILLSSVQQLTGATIETLFIFINSFASALIVIVFYLTVGRLTGRVQLAALSALFISLFRPFVAGAMMSIEDTLAFVCLFLSIFAALNFAHRYQARRTEFLIMAVVAACGVIVTHHLTGYFFLIVLVSLLLSIVLSNQPELSTIKLAVFCGCCFVAMATYWVTVAQPFFLEMVHGAETAVTQIPQGVTITPGVTITSVRLLPAWIPIPRSLHAWAYFPPLRATTGIFDPTFETMGYISLATFYVAGACACIVVLLRSNSRRRMNFFLLWVLILGLSSIIAMFTPFDQFLIPHRQITVLAYPLAVVIAFVLIRAIEVRRKITSLLVYGLGVPLIVILAITAFPLDTYGLGHVKGGCNPFEYTAQDQAVGQWTLANTQTSAFFLADSQGSGILLYSAQREASWDYDINDKAFGTSMKNGSEMERFLHSSLTIRNIPLATSDEVHIDYIMLDRYNKIYGIYTKWANFLHINPDSVIANIDTLETVGLVYNNGKSSIYRIVSD